MPSESVELYDQLSKKLRRVDSVLLGSTALRLFWTLGFFIIPLGATDVLKPRLGFNAGFAIMLTPLILWLIASFLKDSSQPSTVDLGCKLNIASSIAYVVLVTCGVFFGIQEFGSAMFWWLPVAIAGSGTAILVAIDEYRFMRTRTFLILPWTAYLDVAMVIIISAAFTIFGLSLALLNFHSPDQLMFLTTGFFFGSGLLVFIGIQVVAARIKSAPKTPKMSPLRWGDAFALCELLIVCALIHRTLNANVPKDAWYFFACDGLVFTLAVFYLITRWRMIAKKSISYAACREGVLELYQEWYVLYPWDDILTSGLSEIAERILNVSILLTHDEHEYPCSQPPTEPGKLQRYNNWQANRSTRNRANFECHGVQLRFGDAKCLYGIVNVWHSIGLAMSEPSRKDQLPPASALGVIISV